MLLVILTFTKLQTDNQEAVKVDPERQVEYLAYLVGGSDYLSIDEDESYGTAIEEYFL